MGTPDIELEKGFTEKKRETQKSRWAQGHDQPQFIPQVDIGLRKRLLDAVALKSLADSCASTKVGLNAYIDNILSQFGRTQQVFHTLIPTSFEAESDICRYNWFIQNMLIIWESAQRPQKVSLDSLAEALQNGHNIDSSQADSRKKRALTLRFVFFLVGCSTALYTFRSLPVCLETFQIIGSDLKTSFNFNSYLKTQVPDGGTQRPIRDFLQGFGRIPLRAEHVPQDIPESQAKEFIHLTDFNAEVLKRTCGIKVAWTDSLTAHLDYDEESKTVFLFRFPSFCLANIPGSDNEGHINIVQRCWTEASHPSASAALEVANYMKEVLLTTHLIFSQFKRARKLFKVKGNEADPLLITLCHHEWPAMFQAWNYRPRRVYGIHDDFPIFGQRLKNINNQVVLARPKGIRELWKDDRDKLQWFTFWAVVIIGCSGLLLSICQTGLAAVQVWAAVVDRGKYRV